MCMHIAMRIICTTQLGLKLQEETLVAKHVAIEFCIVQHNYTKQKIRTRCLVMGLWKRLHVRSRDKIAECSYINYSKRSKRACLLMDLWKRLHVRSRDKIAEYLQLFHNIWGIPDLKFSRNIGGVAS